MQNEPWVAAAKRKRMTVAADASAMQARYLTLVDQRSRLMLARIAKAGYLESLKNTSVRGLAKNQELALQNDVTQAAAEVASLTDSLVEINRQIDDASAKHEPLLRLATASAKILLDLGVISRTEAGL